MKLSEIKPNPDNPRFIKDDKFKKLVQSLKDFPEMAEVREIVVNKDNVILGGNMRYKAMLEAGWTEAPVKVVDWPVEKQREFIVKDNVSGGEWDWDVLANEWDTDLLDSWGVDLPAGFGDEEIVEDEAPPVADVAISKLGEIYQLGRHRLMCGDATTNIATLMGEHKADMVFTDPPYGVDYEGGSKKRDKIEGDADQSELYELLCPVFNSCVNHSKSGHSIYVCHADNRRVAFTTAFIDSGYYLASVVVWVKNNSTFGRSDYHWKHEPILYGWASNGSHQWLGDRKQDTVWQIDRPNISEQHPTMKPIELVGRAINNSSKSGDIVLDPFGGSGSTLIACEQLDRTCFMMELDPKYCDVIRKRYWKFTHDNNEEGWEAGTPVITEGAPTNGK